jgi:CRISP-associated protein Cas1
LLIYESPLISATMLKRTLLFGSSAYLHLRHNQLVITLPNGQGLERFSGGLDTVPVDDIGIVVLDDPQITISQSLMAMLLENNVALITCNASHHPTGLLLPLDGNSVQSERFRGQIEATEPLKKQLWQQTIQSKILNQGILLNFASLSIEIPKRLQYLAQTTKSGDPDNHEAQAAVYYWANIFPPTLKFRRGREGEPPNNLLNYGYAILRAITARALVCSGLLPTLGIHHHNKYNAYCLADDIMEPYRPFVDKIVLGIMNKYPDDYEVLTKELKAELLGIATVDVMLNEQRHPLMVAMSLTTASLVKCFEGKLRKIAYPTMIVPTK